MRRKSSNSKNVLSVIFFYLIFTTVLVAFGSERAQGQTLTREYRSGPLGFELSLPQTWEVNEFANVGYGFSFLSPDLEFNDQGELMSGAVVTVYLSDEMAEEEREFIAQGGTGYTAFQVDGQPALAYPVEYTGAEAVSRVDILRGDLVYRFKLIHGVDDNIQSHYREAIDRMLESLRFIPISGQLPVKEITISQENLSFLPLSFPFASGNDWVITQGYNGEVSHNEQFPYQRYAFDLVLADGETTGDQNVYAPTNGILAWKETKATKCIDLSIAEASSTEDLYLHICHVDFESNLTNKEDKVEIAKGQFLGTVATDGCNDYCKTPHIHFGAFTGVRGNPWDSPDKMTGVPFDAENNLQIEGIAFPKDDNKINQYADSNVKYQSSISPGGNVTISAVSGLFFPNASDSGAFVATPTDTPAFGQNFPVINFNPPAGTVNCSNELGVDVRTRPFTDVIPQRDGSCDTLPAEGNGYRTGFNSLYNFQAVFTGTFSVSGPARVTFNFYSDDGWILSAGPNHEGQQPTHVSGPLIDPPGTGPFTGYSVVGSFNTRSAPSQNDLVVDFPGGGNFPFELDYSECCGGELVLTMTAENIPIPEGGMISGTVYAEDAKPSNVLPGAFVEVCRGRYCEKTLTGANGQYSIAGLPGNQYTVTAYAPSGRNLIEVTSGPIPIAPQDEISNYDLILKPPTPPPAGTSITSRNTADSSIPIVFWNEPLTLTTTGCVGGNSQYKVLQSGIPVREGSMSEVDPGKYVATIPSLYPNHGNAKVEVSIACTDSTDTLQFDMYIDPSGVVKTTSGDPAAWATVTLLHSDSLSGPFELVPDGSNIMSLANRANPDISDLQGRFGWDVITGYYKVRAEKIGCTAPSKPTQSFVESEAVVIPPAVTDMELILECSYGVPKKIDLSKSTDEITIGSGSKSEITVRVSDSSGSPVPLETIIFSSSLGVIDSETAVTGLNGTVTTSLKAGTVAGVASITATVPARGLSAETDVRILSQGDNIYLPFIGR